MSFSKLKNYTDKVYTRLLFSKVYDLELVLLKNGHFLPTFSNKINILYYLFLKQLKMYKLNTLSKQISSSSSIGWKLEGNGFYNSIIESEKGKKINLLHKKILSNYNKTALKPTVWVNMSLSVDNRNFKSLSKGFDKYDKFYGNYLKMVEKRQAFLKILKQKRFFNQIFVSRLFSHVTKCRKKYRSNFSYFFRRKRKVSSLFHLYTLSSLKFRDARKQRKKVLRRLAWKVKKDKKWKRNNSFNLFRLRQRLSQSFYVPKHFEVNYKTLGICYLGYTDFKTTNTRIPFWLNLRKLLTFLV